MRVSKQNILFGLVTPALIILFALLFQDKVQHKMRDFEVYWQAGTRAIAAESLYRPEDEHYQLKYLPAFALAVSPLSRLSLPTAKALWYSLSVALVFLILFCSWRLLPRHHQPAWILLLLTLTAMAKFYGHELVLGQSNLLMMSLVLLALGQMRSGKETWAGLLLGLAVVAKPYAVIFLPYLALRRRADSFFTLCVVLLLLLFLPSLLYGQEGNFRLLLGWVEATFGTTIPNLTSQDSVSILGMYSKWLGIGPTAFALSLITIGVLVAVFVLVFCKRADRIFPEYLEMSLLLTLIPLFSPSGWDYTLLLSTPAIMCLVNYFGDLSLGSKIVTGIALVTIGFSLYDVLGRSSYALFMSYSPITLCYFVVIASLYQLRTSGGRSGGLQAAVVEP